MCIICVKLEPFGYQKDIQTVRGIGYILKNNEKGSMFQKTRIRLTIVNSLVFILLIGILGSIIYSYTYKRIYNEVDQSIKMLAQYREKLDVKIPPRKRMENIQIGDPRIVRITWNGKTVKIEEITVNFVLFLKRIWRSFLQKIRGFTRY